MIIFYLKNTIIFLYNYSMSPLRTNLNLNIDEIEEVVLFNLSFGITEEQTLSALLESNSITEETLAYYRFLHD